MQAPDTTNAKSNEFPPITTGWYEAKISNFEEKTDKNGNLYLEVAFDFVDSNRKAWTNLSYSSDFLWQLKTFKQAIRASDTETELEPYKDTRLMIFCKNKKYNDKNQIDVVEFKAYGETDDNPVPSPEPSMPADDDDLPF